MAHKIAWMAGLGVLLFLSACGDDSDSGLANTGTSPGVCNITKNINDALCLTISSSISNNDASDYCSGTFYPMYQASISANGYGFVSVLLEADVSCVDTDEIGTCQMSAGVISYYSTEYNTTTAEDDCLNNQLGTWNETSAP